MTKTRADSVVKGLDKLPGLEHQRAHVRQARDTLLHADDDAKEFNKSKT
jgi:hypothetical protein